MTLEGRELPDDVLDLIREYSKPIVPYYQIYCKALRVLRLQRWCTLYDTLYGDNTSYLIPLLLSYLKVVVHRMKVDQELFDHYAPGRTLDNTEGTRLSHLYAEHKMKEDRLFEELIEELYFKPKKRWELDDMIATIGTKPEFIHYRVYNEAKRVLHLGKWTALFDALHTNADVIPLLVTYQEAFVARQQMDQALLDHYTQWTHSEPKCSYDLEEFNAEGVRLSQLFVEQQVVEDSAFERLTKDLYGEPKRRWQLHYDMETTF